MQCLIQDTGMHKDVWSPGGDSVEWCQEILVGKFPSSESTTVISKKVVLQGNYHRTVLRIQLLPIEEPLEEDIERSEVEHQA